VVQLARPHAVVQKHCPTGLQCLYLADIRAIPTNLNIGRKAAETLNVYTQAVNIPKKHQAYLVWGTYNVSKET